MTDKQQPPERIWIDPQDSTFWNDTGDVKSLIPYARVHPVDDARVEEIRARRKDTNPALYGDTTSTAGSLGAAKDDIDYLLSRLKDGGAEGREPADMFNEELDAAMDFHRSEAARFANERAKIWRLRIRLNGGEDVDKQMLAELHARRTTAPAESSDQRGEK